MRLRPALVVLLFVFAAIPSFTDSGDARAASTRTIRLRTGQSAFWSGTSRPNWERLEYRIAVLERAASLRVAIDHGGGPYEYVALTLIQPGGGSEFHDAPYYSAEGTVPHPKLGVWTARVEAYGETPFRMRAKLERPARPVPGARPLLPNLRMLPPFEITFSADRFGFPPAGMVGLTNGCYADEVVNYQATRCLRFSSGPGNVGAGDLKLHFQPSATVLFGDVQEEIQYSDGSTKLVPAGTYQYHAGHLHFHHAGFGGFDLLRVDDERTGAMTAVGRGPKLGFCMDDYILMTWRSFTNGPAHRVGRNCAGTGDDPAQPMYTGLTKGWADVYAHFQEGMFVDFADNPDGLYVIRVHGNAADSIVESNHNDNDSYAYVRVTGSSVEVLERGFGASPWDPGKVVASDLLPGTPRY
ncbi:MAG: hypothetical protein LC722_01635 [Actinobacteria bacterium]|nr:hypothetical protein [Actinomycetota bacterium]